jgi:hypothetical protein
VGTERPASPSPPPPSWRSRPGRARVEHAPHLAQRRHGVGEEEERDETGDGRELSVGEGHRIDLRELDPRSRLPASEPYHLGAVIEPGDRAAGLAHSLQEGTTAAADVEQAVLAREAERLEHRRPE